MLVAGHHIVGAGSKRACDDHVVIRITDRVHLGQIADDGRQQCQLLAVRHHIGIGIGVSLLEAGLPQGLRRLLQDVIREAEFERALLGILEEYVRSAFGAWG